MQICMKQKWAGTEKVDGQHGKTGFDKETSRDAKTEKTKEYIEKRYEEGPKNRETHTK